MANASRRALYRLAAGDTAGRVIRAHPAIERRASSAARRYVAGETLDEALATIETLTERGLATSIDYFGERVTDPAIAERIVEEYLDVGRAIGRLDHTVDVWIDLSNVGLEISADLCRRHVERIVAGLPERSRIQIRAHSSERNDGILDVATALAADGAAIVMTLPANLHRSTADAERLIDARIPALVVKGASLEPAERALPWGEPTDVAFLRLVHQLRAGGVEVAIGTHDPVLREALLATIDGLAVEMLLGVRAGDAEELAQRGHRVRIYVPYGRDWVRHWLRRLGEARGA